MYLLDTNVVSELRRRKPHGAVVGWLEGTPAEQLFVSAVTIGELQSSIELTREQDEAKANALEVWLGQVVESFAVVPMDAAAFRKWAQLKHRQSDTLVEDAMIAAIAEVHNFAVVTRNVRDFEVFGSRILNPFET